MYRIGKDLTRMSDRRNDLCVRICAIVCFGLWWIARALLVSFEPNKLVWLSDVVYLSLVIASYVLRSPVRGRAVGFRERYFPFVAPGLAASLLTQPVSSLALAPFAFPLMLAGGVLFCLGVWSLRRNFSIMVEVRTVVERGIYRYVRHPIYLGHLLASLGATLLRLSWCTALIYAGIMAGQVYRAVLEERKLAAFCPEYARYQQRVPMFGVRLPLPHRVQASSRSA